MFLFLYPITRYFEACLVDCLRLFKGANNNFRRINDIIDARYRKRGYSVNWLMFSKERDLESPDLSLLSSYLRVMREDNLLVSGISFKEHTIQKKYPNLEVIFGQIPKLEKLVIGGFHQWDCVNKLAKYAYRKGIPTLVDEDTTDMFFITTYRCRDIPLIRNEFTSESLGLKGLEIGLFRKMREGKPWFTQI